MNSSSDRPASLDRQGLGSNAREGNLAHPDTEPISAIRPRPLKRAFDVCLSASAILLLTPLLVAIAVAITLEGLKLGRRIPVLYGERRISRGRPFTLWKFHTIRPDLDLGPDSGVISVKHLERKENLSRVGRFLQNYYLDELPQLFSILRGQMSFVGPRPMVAFDYQREIDRRIVLRKWIPAGLTGQFQVQKGIGKFRERRVSLDMEYFDKYVCCGHLALLVYDLNLIRKTAGTLLRGGGW